MRRRQRRVRAATMCLAAVTLTAACSSSSRHAAGSSAPPTARARGGDPGGVGVNTSSVYAYTKTGMFNAVTREARPLIYVPERIADRGDVIDPSTYRVIGSDPTGDRPQHVGPSWDLRTASATN